MFPLWWLGFTFTLNDLDIVVNYYKKQIDPNRHDKRLE